MSFNIYETGKQDGKGREPSSAGAEKNASALDTSGVKPRRFNEYNSVADQDIFRTSRTDAGEPLEQAEELEITPLNLKLKGVVLGLEAASFAVIYDEQSKKEDLYYLNDYIQGARMVQVMPDRIILSRQGKQEVLMLEVESPPERRRERRNVIKGKRPMPRKVEPGR
jgi:type II secretion system protein C